MLMLNVVKDKDVSSQLIWLGSSTTWTKGDKWAIPAVNYSFLIEEYSYSTMAWHYESTDNLVVQCFVQ